MDEASPRDASSDDVELPSPPSPDSLVMAYEDDRYNGGEEERQDTVEVVRGKFKDVMNEMEVTFPTPVSLRAHMF